MPAGRDEAARSAKVGGGAWNLLKSAGLQWVKHKSPKAGAALSYYSVFSLGPLIVVVISIAALVFGREGVQHEVTAAIRGLLGDKGAEAVNMMLTAAGKPSQGLFATIIGTAALVFAAVGAVVQLKEALNAVWETPASSKSGLWSFARTYVFSFAGVLGLGFLLLISTLLTAGLAAFGKYMGTFVPEAFLQTLGFFVSFLTITLLFALMFRWMPDAAVQWRDVWMGAVGTAVLFEIGKFLIAFYIGKQGLDSTYGASASIVVVLIWVYYSAQIVLLGAELTHARAQQRAEAGDRTPLRDDSALGSSEAGSSRA